MDNSLKVTLVIIAVSALATVIVFVFMGSRQNRNDADPKDPP